MSTFLSDFLLTMPATQQERLKHVLEERQREGFIRSEHELELELNRLLQLLDESNGPTFQPRSQEERTNATTYNQNMNEIAFDLDALYSASNTINRLLRDNKQLARSIIEEMKQRVYSMEAKVERYKLLLNSGDSFTEGVFEQFKAAQYTESDQDELSTLRRGRLGNPIDRLFDAEISSGTLQLASIESENQLATSYGRRLAGIKIRNRIGYAPKQSKHPVEHAIDGSSDTFWAENVLSEHPIVQNVSDSWSADHHDYSKSGAVCELEIKLNGLSTVSEISFHPYCAYPMEIVSITGYETEEFGGVTHYLISPQHEIPHQRSQKSVDRMTFQFESVSISSLRILVRQENYIKENYLVESSKVRDANLWNSMIENDKLYRTKKAPGETVATMDKKNKATGWTGYLNQLTKWAKKNKENTILDAARSVMDNVRLGDYKNPLRLALQAVDSDKKVPLQKNERKQLEKEWMAMNQLSYLYGAYHIGVTGRTYHPESVYVSKPLPLSSNASRMSLVTEEKHHDVVVEATKEEGQVHTARVTDVEYYISDHKTPGVSDWKAILPTNHKYVMGELLMAEMVGGDEPEFEGISLLRYSLRFICISSETLVIRRNGIPMSPSTYVVTADGKKVGIRSEYFSASSIYTADYKPDDSAYLVDIQNSADVQPTQYIDTNGEIGEFFDEVDHNNSVTLKHQPFLFRKQLFKYEESKESYSLQTGRLAAKDPYFPLIVRVNGKEYKNITNYETNNFDEARLTENGGEVFAHIGNKITFGKLINGKSNEMISIDYHYLTSNIRLKAILRRNSTDNESVTPSVYNYKIQCQSYDLEV